MITKNEVLLWKKYALTLSEAAQYFGIGERKLQQIADDNRDTGIVIYNGVKLLFKRERFSYATAVFKGCRESLGFKEFFDD